jgi:Domain of unknown function (DUF4149)
MRALVAVVVASLWMGAALLLIASVAPAAFATIPSQTVAGVLVGRVLSPVFLTGFAGGVALTVAAVQESPSPGRRAQVLAAVAWGLTCGVSQFVLAPRIRAIQDAIGGPISGLAADDARRMAFGRLHGTIFGVYLLAILSAAAIVMLAALALRARTSHS